MAVQEFGKVRAVGKRPIQDNMAATIIRQSMERALEAVGVLLEKVAARNVREVGAIDTGRLRGSITHATKAEGRSAVTAPARQRDAVHRPSSKFEVWIGTNVEYAPHVEYGTKKMTARPYMRPALDNNRKLVRKLFADALAEGFQRGK